MTSGEPKPRRKRRWILGGIGLLILVVLIAAAFYVRSASFNNYVRARVIARLEEATGGRVELKSLTWKLSTLQFDIRDLTIHGREAADQAPYFHAEHVLLRAKIGVLFRPKIGLRSLEVDRPVLHLLVYSDGSTNQPEPRRRSAAPIQTLFDLAINHAEVRNGELLVNERSMPLNFSGDDISAGLDYVANAKRYDGNISVGRMNTKVRDWLPVGSAAEVQFSVLPAALELKRFRWTTGASQAEGTARIFDFNQLNIDATFTARLDLAQFSDIMDVPEVRKGVLELNGRAVYTPAGIASTGKLLVRNGEYADTAVHVRNVNLGAEFSVTPQRLVFPHLFANYLGGTVVGSAEIKNWTAPGAPLSSKGKRPASPEGVAHLRFQNVLLPEVTAVISTRTLPLDRLGLAGTAGGAVNMRWTGSLANAEADINAQVSPPSRPASGQLPVSGRIRADYSVARGYLRVGEFDLATRASRLSGSGTLGRTTGNLRLTASSTNVGELQPILSAFHLQSRLPLEVAGRATFDGTVKGSFVAPAIAGHLEVRNFETLLALTRQPGAPVRRLHWDLLSTDVLYSSKMAAVRNAVLRSGRAQLNFDFSTGLDRGAYTDTSPLSAHLVVHDAEVNELQALMGYTYPISGTVSANVALSGTERDPRGGSHFLLTSAVAYGEPVASFSADVLVANRQAAVSNIHLAHNGARVTGTAAFNLANKGLSFDLRGTDFNLAHVRRLQTPRLTVGGGMSFAARGSGTWDAPLIDANVRLTRLVLNGELAGDFTATAVSDGSDLRITGRSDFQNADFRVDGVVRLRDDFPADVNVRFTHLDFDALLRAYLKGRVTGHSSAAGVMHVRGPLRHPQDITATGSLDQLSANLENVVLQNDGPARFSLTQRTFRLEQLRLVGEDTSISASGSVQLAPPRRLDLRVDGHANLKLLQSYNSDLTSNGTATFGLNLEGVATNPLVEGKIQIADAGVSHVDLPNGLSNVNGVLVFNRDRLVVQSLTARTGGGTLNLGGFVTYRGTVAFNLTATGRDIRLRYPPGISSMANADLTLTGTEKNATLAGDIIITKFGVNPQFDFATYVARAKQPPETPKPNSLLNSLHLDVHIASTPELQVQTSLAKVTGDADLRLRGVASKPVVLGRVNIIEGDIFFNGTKYHMERGDVIFSNPVRIEPVLDIEATARVKEYDVTLGFHGPLDRLTTNYRSDPPLPTADIIALLALGHTREESTAQTQSQPQQPSFGETASYALLNEALSAAVSSRVQRIFGVSRIKIDPQAATVPGSTYTGPQLSIEQQVNNNITLTYITNLSQGNQQTIQLQYDINRNVSIIAIRDDLTGVVSFDVRVRQRKK